MSENETYVDETTDNTDASAALEPGFVEVNAKTSKREDRGTVTCIIDLGQSLEDAVEKFGADVVFGEFQAKAKISAQAAMRRLMEADKSDDEITNIMATWKPGVTMPRQAVDPVASIKTLLAGLSAEEKMAKLEELGLM